MGNHHPVLAPHNSYECEDSDRPGWIVLAVEHDEQWRRLAGHIGDWRLDPSWDQQARKAQEPAIDAAITDWARGRKREELVAELQALGVAASPSMNVRDLYENAHIRQRGMWTRVDHARLGDIEVLSMPWLVNGARPVMHPAPALGQHNDYVYREILGLTPEEQAALAASGVAY